MIDLSLDRQGRAVAVGVAADRGIVIPTLAQQRDPRLVPEATARRLASVGLWEVDPVNLFRITWHNEPVEHGGGFGPVNVLEFPSEITGVEARIVALVGKWFPTGAHKVGAAFGCLVPRLVTGRFDPTRQQAVWPSTGNYCRGGAYDSALLGCESIAILPEGMSRERFEWLEGIAGRIVRTPGSESNVKEIFDACWELQRSGEDVVIFNQFDELGNYLWHYSVTGSAMLEAFDALDGAPRLAAVVACTGSAGTIASGDLVKQHHPDALTVAGEALQCPTLLMNGYGEHRIEGIGDKHVPWIHNTSGTDAVVAVDDAAALAVFRLFNEPAGVDHLVASGVDPAVAERLDLVGISGAANLLASIALARHERLGPDDVVLTVLTDSADMYRSRLDEMNQTGAFGEDDAARVHRDDLFGQGTDHMVLLDDMGRRRIHNLKYFTWVEQQGKTVAELNQQWEPGYWEAVQAQVTDVDRAITEFNDEVADAAARGGG